MEWTHACLYMRVTPPHHHSFLITEAPPEANDPANDADADADAASAERRLEAVAGALQVAVLLGIEREIAAFHPGYRLATK